MASTKQQQQVEEINWDGVNKDAQDPVSLQLPLVLWRHGKAQMKQLGAGNINYTGGFFFSRDAAGADTTIEYWSEQSFDGDKGEVFGLGASQADVAFVRARKRWFKEGKNSTEFRNWNNYESGFRAHLQCVGFLKGFDHPVIFSFKGLLGQAIAAIQREHMSKVLSLINRTAPQGNGLPPYGLWVRIKSGKHEKVGGGDQQAEATLPIIALPDACDLAFAKSRFVGNELLQRMQALYTEAGDWSREWEYTIGAVASEKRDGATADPAINDPHGAYSPADKQARREALQSKPEDDEIPF